MGSISDRFKVKTEKKNSSTGQSVTEHSIKKPVINHIVRSIARENIDNRPPEATLNNFDQFDWPRYEVKSPLEEYEIQNAYMKHKYILFLHPQLGPTAATFASWNVHADIYRNNYRRYPLISAGFYSIDSNNKGEMRVRCFGESISLDVKSRGEKDEIFVAQSLGIMELYA